MFILNKNMFIFYSFLGAPSAGTDWQMNGFLIKEIFASLNSL